MKCFSNTEFMIPCKEKNAKYPFSHHKVTLLENLHIRCPSCSFFKKCEKEWLRFTANEGEGVQRERQKIKGLKRKRKGVATRLTVAKDLWTRKRVAEEQGTGRLMWIYCLVPATERLERICGNCCTKTPRAI